MSESLSTEQERPDHRHMWMVSRTYLTPTGKQKQLLRCRLCEASKGRFVKPRPPVLR